MCGADIREIAAGRFNIVMVAGNAGVLQAAELFRVNKTHGSAKLNLQLCVHFFIGFNSFVKVFAL